MTARRPVVLSGVTERFRRGDFLSRTLVLRLPPPLDEDRLGVLTTEV